MVRYCEVHAYVRMYVHHCNWKVSTVQRSTAYIIIYNNVASLHLYMLKKDFKTPGILAAAFINGSSELLKSLICQKLLVVTFARTPE